MSADGFTVDYVALADLAQQLANLRGEFEKDEEAIQPLLGTLSDQELKKKLSEFAKNWSEKKYSIVHQLDKVAGLAKSAADAYCGVDEAYAEGFSGAGATGGGSP